MGRYAGRLFKIALVLSGAAALLVGLLWLNVTSPRLEAVDGYIDARFIDLQNGPYMLSGSWYGRPTAGAADDKPTLYKNISYERKMRGFTYTFALQTASAPDISFMLPRPFGSRMWVNGQPVKNGERITSADVFEFRDFSEDSDIYEIILEVNSTSYYDGYQGVLVGNDLNLRNAQMRWLYLDIVAVGLHAMLILYSLVMFAQKRSEVYLLFLAMTAFADILHFLNISRYPLKAVVPLLPSPVMRQFYALNYFVCCQFVPKPPKWMDYTVYATIGVSVLAQVFVPGQVMLVLRYAGYIQMLFQLYMLVLAIWRRVPYAAVILVGWSVSFTVESVFYAIINNGLMPQGIVDVQIMPAEYAQFAYIVALAVAATGKFAEKFAEADELAASLEKKVQEQTHELRIANERLLEEQVRRHTLMTDLVHNIRSPLFALGGYIDLLRDARRQPTADEEKYLERIDSKLSFLGEMVNDMFLAVRLEDGRVEFRFTEFPLAAMIENACSDAMVKAAQKGLHVSAVCIPQGITCVGDEFRLKQVMDILLDNAVRHSRQNGAVSITAGIQATPRGDIIALSVADEGAGIEPAQIDRLFERYSAGSGGATGLGLSIAKHIVEYHHGNISACNNPVCGSTFTVELPLSSCAGD